MLTLNVNKQVALGGVYYTNPQSVNHDAVALFDLSVPAALGGVLTTQASATAGSLTLGTGHGVATGNRLDLYWTLLGVNYARRGTVVGTVAGLAVPFSGGLGDNLPPASTAITCMVPVYQPQPFTGSNAVGFAAACEALNATLVFVDGANAELLSVAFRTANYAYSWTSLDGTANPLTGAAVAGVFASTGDAAAVRRLFGAVAIS